MNSHPVLTERLKIRTLLESDIEALMPIFSNPLVAQYIPYDPWKSNADAKAWFQKTNQRVQNGHSEQYVIERQTDNTIIGTCLYFNHNKAQSSAEFGYVLGHSYWGQGYMLEAMSAFVDTLSDKLNLSLLHATVEPPNAASLALLSKLGFEKSGIVYENGVELFQLNKVLPSGFSSND